MIFRFIDATFQGRLALLLIVSLVLAACGKTDISDIEHVNRAKQYQSTGDFKATLIELKSALQQNPKNSEARLLLGELYVLIGNGAAAEKELNKAMQLGVSGSYIQKLQGKSLLLQGRYDDVLAMLSKMDVSSQAELLVLQGEAQLGLRENDLAQAAFQKALLIKPDDSAALLGQARVYMATGVLQKAVDKVDAVLKVALKNAEAWVLKGNLATQQARTEDAQIAYQRAIEIVTANLITRVGMRARTGLTKLLITQRKFDEATAHVEYLLKASPKNPMPNYMAGLLAYERKQYAKARDYFQTVLKSSPNHLSSVFLLGSVNYALGHIEQAEQQLERVIAAKPSLLSARMLLASIRLQQAQTDQALNVLEPALAQQPNDVRLLAMAGQAALRSGEFEKGRGFLQKAVAKQPKAGGLRAQLAMLHLAEGNDALAIEELEQAIKLGKAPAREKSMLALTYLRKKDFAKALSTAKDLAENHPKNAYPHNLLGVIFGAKGDISQARGAFSEALKLEPEFTSAALNLARLDVLAGRSSDARERLDGILVRDKGNTSAMMALAQLADAGNDRKQALEWLEKARDVDSKALAPRLLLVRYYTRTGKLDRAREVARETIAIDNSTPQVLKVLGQVELVSQNYSAAVNTFKKIVKQAPNAPAYYSLGVAQFRANNESAARSSLKKVLKLRPDHLQALSLLVLLDVKAGRIDEAIRRVNDIKRLHSKSPAGFVLEGDIRAHQKQNVKAASAYTKARELGGGTRVLLKEVDALQNSQGSAAAIKLLASWVKTHRKDVTAQYALATTYSREGRSEDAMNEYNRLLEGAPKYVPALNDLAWLLYQDGKSGEALQLIEKAYELRPDSGPVLDTIGWIRLHQGDTKQALSLLRQAAEKMPDTGDVQYHLAEVLARSGKKAESRDILKRILGADRSFPAQREAQQLLGKL